MKKIVIILVSCLIPATSPALEKVTDVKLLKKFAENITASGNSCRLCTDAYLTEKDDKGTVYKVICNNDVIPFYVTVTPAGKFLVGRESIQKKLKLF